MTKHNKFEKFSNFDDASEEKKRVKKTRWDTINHQLTPKFHLCTLLGKKRSEIWRGVVRWKFARSIFFADTMVLHHSICENFEWEMENERCWPIINFKSESFNVFEKSQTYQPKVFRKLWIFKLGQKYFKPIKFSWSFSFHLQPFRL